MRKKLTDKLVIGLRAPTGDRLEVWDQLLPGFGLRIGPRSRTWIVAVRRPDKAHPVRLRIGEYPAMGLGEARDAARALMLTGAPATTTFGGIVDAFLEHGRAKKGATLREGTRHQYRRAMGRHARALHQRPLREITQREVAALIADVASTSGGPTASLVRSMLSRVFGYAIEIGELERNPATGTPGYAVPKRARVLTDDELVALWQGTDAYPVDLHMIIRLCLWTGCRRSEAGGMGWHELAGGIWTIPGSRTKNGRALPLPLPRQALAAIETWPRVVGRALLFGAQSPNGFSQWSEHKRELDARLGFNRPWVLHTLRATVETRMAKLGIPKDHVNRALNHAIGQVTETYDHHDYLPEKAQALQRWADELDRLVYPA